MTKLIVVAASPFLYDCQDERKENDSPDDIKVLNFFNDINDKASKVGGAVYSLLGNHEMMNAQGKFYYVSYDNYFNFNYFSADGKLYEGPGGRRDAFNIGGPLSTMMACKRQSVLVIGSTMFIHAGVLPVLAKRLEHLNIDDKSKLKYLNTIVRKWLLKKFLSSEDSAVMNIVLTNQDISPFWTRVYGVLPNNMSLTEKQCSDSVKKIMEVLKIGHIVVGHTPQLFTNRNGINGTCYEVDGDNKLYRIDGGFSKAFDVFNNKNLVQILEILDDKKFKIITDKTIKMYKNPPDVGISENQLKTTYRYAQNRVGNESETNTDIDSDTNSDTSSMESSFSTVVMY